MKEYKVVNTRAGVLKRNEKLETLLNQYSREGWELKFMHQTFSVAIFEREKNKY